MVKYIRWIARIWSLLSIAFVLVFFVGEGFDPRAFSGIEWLMFFFFPIGTLAGLVQGWKKEAIGGSVTLFSFAAFYIVDFISTRSFPKGPYFFLIMAPGLLFLLCWFLTHDQRTS
ncbi:MAG: hypothetical protein JW814_00800 [Candidatus Krumholzibacteriota bacterium]|nr:hypothetical protein [Candidatus Krumholzibacteriota bacterium]